VFLKQILLKVEVIYSEKYPLSFVLDSQIHLQVTKILIIFENVDSELLNFLLSSVCLLLFDLALQYLLEVSAVV
jgi:hypothetical protein